MKLSQNKPDNWPFKYNHWDNNYLDDKLQEKPSDKDLLCSNKMTKQEIQQEPEGLF